MTMLSEWTYAADAPMAQMRTLIRITPTRTYVERRFPTLGFTVDAGGLLFFEVLLTTDRTLFDPANASRRTPATFYASREHSGLIRADNEAAVYLVPTSVMRRFAGAREIFYTAAGYMSAQGQDPAYAMPPAQLSREAPSVGVASDFMGRSFASSFAIPANVLQRVRDDGAYGSSASGNGSGAMTQAYGDVEFDADADRVAGEDGYGLSASIDYDDNAAPMNAAEGGDADMSYAADDEPEAASAAGLDYYDGYDEPIPASSASEASAYGGYDEDDYAASTTQQNAYESDASEPSMLEDEDEARRERDGTYTSAGYGDEADDAAAPAPAYKALDTVPLTPREQRRIMDTLLAAAWPGGSYTSIIPETDAASTPGAGLSVGIAPFTQWSGALGELLKTMEQRDGGAFRRIFGPKWKELRDSASAAKPADRMKAVDGADLWRVPWLARFKNAGTHKPFQAAQNETAAVLFLQPIISYAFGLGLNSDRGLLMLAAILRRISFNVENPLGAAIQWLVTAASPLKTDAQRQQALVALGSAFQEAQHIEAGKTWSNLQHYAVLAELRRSGRSPVPLPSRRESLDLIVKYAADYKDPMAPELNHLRTIASLQDVEYSR
jgi:hypothetical protein